MEGACSGVLGMTWRISEHTNRPAVPQIALPICVGNSLEAAIPRLKRGSQRVVARWRVIFSLKPIERDIKRAQKILFKCVLLAQILTPLIVCVL